QGVDGGGEHFRQFLLVVRSGGLERGVEVVPDRVEVVLDRRQGRGDMPLRLLPPTCRDAALMVPPEEIEGVGGPAPVQGGQGGVGGEGGGGGGGAGGTTRYLGPPPYRTGKRAGGRSSSGCRRGCGCRAGGSARGRGSADHVSLW